MFVCLCKSVTDHDIRDAVDEGVTSFEAMQSRLSVSTQCGSCTCEVKAIMEDKLNQTLNVRASVSPSHIRELVL
jgi:bacterioferritin-associated ferredoxin